MLLAVLLAAGSAHAGPDDPLPVSPDGLQVLSRVDPQFPPSLKGAAGGKSAEYVCTIQVVVERSGVPSSATPQDDPACPPAAAAASQVALMQWRWHPPTLLTGEVVRASTPIRMRFRETEVTGHSGRPIAADSLQVLRAGHQITPDGFPTCNLSVGVDREGLVLQRRTNQPDCLVRPDAAVPVPDSVPRGSACLITFESSSGTAEAIRMVQCPKEARTWARTLLSGWRWLTPTDKHQGYMLNLQVLR